MNQHDITKPQLSEIASSPSAVRLPPYVTLETEDCFQIAFNFCGAEDSSLHAYLSTDRSRLHVVGKRDLLDSTANYLWIFQLPKNVDPEEISVDRKQDVYLIEIPKRKFWSDIKNTLEHLFQPRAQAVSNY